MPFVATTNSRTKAAQAVRDVCESLKQALGRGQRTELRSFGVFSVKTRKTGSGRNPAPERGEHPAGKSPCASTRQRTTGIDEQKKKAIAPLRGPP